MERNYVTVTLCIVKSEVERTGRRENGKTVEGTSTSRRPAVAGFPFYGVPEETGQTWKGVKTTPVSRRDRATPHNLRNSPPSNPAIFARFQLLFAPEVRQISQTMWRRAVPLRHLRCMFRLLFTVFRSFSLLVRSARTFGTERPEVKVKYMDIAVCSLTCHTATGTHMPCGIAQCVVLILVCAVLTAHLSVRANSAPQSSRLDFGDRERKGEDSGRGKKGKRRGEKREGTKGRRRENKGKEKKGKREGEWRNVVQLWFFLTRNPGRYKDRRLKKSHRK